MSYVDIDYYKIIFQGAVIPDDEVNRQLRKSSDQIDSMTFNRIASKGFDSLSQFQQDKVRRAVCTQAEFIYQFGQYLDIPLEGFSAGSLSLNFKSVEAAGGVKTSEEVMNLLRSTGLTSRRL